MSTSRGAVLGAFLLFSLKEQWSVYRKKFKRCEKDASEDRVHDVRIATRQLLSILGLLVGIIPEKHLQAAQRELKSRLTKLGRLRDTHTQLLGLEKLCHNLPEAKIYYKELAKRECHLNKRIHRQWPHLKSGRLADSMSAIKKCLRCLIYGEEKEKVFDRALTTLQDTYENTVDCYRAIQPADNRTLHQTRVAFKQFRYMMEVLQPMLPDLTQDTLKSMHNYQARMGDIQDMEVLLASLDKFLKKQKLSGKGWKHFRVALVRRQATLLHQFMVSANELFEFDPIKHLSRRTQKGGIDVRTQ